MKNERSTVSLRARVNDLNRQRVLHEIWTDRGVSRAQLAHRLRLNKSTISDITTPLLEQGLIVEIAVGESTPRGGRRPKQLSINRAFGAVVGLDLRSEENVAVVMDLEGRVIFSTREERSIDGKTAVPTCLERLESIRGEASRRGRRLLGAGVGVSALVDSPRGVILQSGDLGIEGPLSFLDAVGAEARLPVFLERNANCCSWERLVFHRDPECRTFLSLLVRFKDRAALEGKPAAPAVVGMGIVIDGEVFYGADHTAGEFRSVLLTSRPGDQMSLDNEELLRLGEDRDLLVRFVQELARNVAFLVHALDLGCIFVGGDLEKHRDLVTPVFERAIADSWIHAAPHRCGIEYFPFDRETVAHGAAAMVLHRLFSVERGLGPSTDRHSATDLWSRAGEAVDL